MYAELEKLPKYTPDYVVDEVKYHFDKISEGKNDIFTLENVISLVNLAKVNNRVYPVSVFYFFAKNVEKSSNFNSLKIYCTNFTKINKIFHFYDIIKSYFHNDWRSNI